MRRNNIMIVANILNLCSHQTLRITNINYKANLQYSKTKVLVNLLVDRGLLATDNGLYKTTSQGFVYLQHYRDMMKMLGEFLR